MAVVNTKSTQVTNADADPVVFNDPLHTRAPLYVQSATVEVAAADDNGSTYRMCRVHSSWSIKRIKVWHDAITGGSDYDLGVYDVAEAGGAVIDKDCYADASDMSVATESGPTNGGEFRFRDTASSDPSLINQRVWEDAGLSADPDKWMDLVFTANTVGTAAGTITAEIFYTEQ